MRGRKPKDPDATRLIQGKPVSPADLDAVGRREWKRIAKIMEERGTLSQEFESSMALYCHFFSMWAKANDAIKKKGLTYKANGLMKANPAIKIAQQLAPSLRGLLSDLCLTPASRTRLKNVGPKEEDEFDALLARCGDE